MKNKILITIAVIIIAIFVFMWYRDNQVKRNKPETKIDPEK